MSLKGWLCVMAGAAMVAAPVSLLAESASYYRLRMEDKKAVYLVRNEGGLYGDGVGDDTDAIQQAINKVQETTGQGIVFVPEGRYRILKTVFLWPGVRLIGWGAHRPAFVLGKNTPGYQQGMGYMLMFTGNRPRDNAAPVRQGRPQRPVEGVVPLNPAIADANPGTFYSAVSNIDFDIEEGNPAAVGIRFHAAQHCYLAHMDFNIGSGLAGIHDAGNEAEDLHFYGGQYGIMTRKPSPGWQFTLLDATFEGQREAAIKEHEAGLTLIRAQISKTPTAISIDPKYAEELWVKDARFEDISGPAVIVSNENGLRTEINLEGVVCRHVPVFVGFRESGRKVEGRGEMYRVNALTHGLTFASGATQGEVKTSYDATALSAMPPAVASDIPALPAQETWVNLQELGAKGDGTTDDTAAIRRAIAGHRAIYVPSGRYIVTDTITLRPDTVLIGLNPTTTQFDIPDTTAAFQGPGSPKALLETPKGGTNIVTGIGLYTDGINSRAVGAKWMAGKDSLMDDVRFLGGHGTTLPGVSFATIYNNTHTADTDLNRRWDGQYPSLWVTDGGGGTFANIWTPSTFAQAGMLISNTTTPGRVYELSSEHHVRNEVMLDHAANWQIYALQTEEERGEGPFCLPLWIEHSENVTVANYHGYRVVSSYQPFLNAIHVADSKGIRFRNVHVYGDNKVSFDNSLVIDGASPLMIRNREFAALSVDASVVGERPAGQRSTVLADGAKVERLTGGFYNVSGAAVDGAGQLYFVDAHWQRIYRWLPEERRAEIVRDSPLDPVQLAFDKAGDLMVVSYAGKGTVYWFRPDARDLDVTLIAAQKTAARPGMTAVLPVNYWRNENDFVKAVPTQKLYQFVSPDGSTYIPAGEDFVTGALYYGTKMADVLRAFSLGRAVEGRPFYVSDESEQKTYSANVGPDGTLTDVKLFAECGGENVAQDAEGNVYIAAGQVYVYSSAGKLIDRIDVPERPIDLVFGGKDGKTLYILARTSLYSVETRAKGL
ncbi:glycosyl hydrolase family 28-related protein [Edaphobacter aggregans]|uniref:glycosyl hydrolase family 28-related protein n=1 Tax=Edaphobacter aggregans TaxID=570835 RepID=UPI001FE035AF|nr:glycosyl hydrolase family 28-related protein [Edaphobacter aggregans]